MPNDATSPSPLTQILYPPRTLLPQHNDVQDEHYNDLPFFRRNTRQAISFILSKAPFSQRQQRPPSPPKQDVITGVQVAVIIAMPDPQRPIHSHWHSPQDSLEPETSKSAGKAKEVETEIEEVDQHLPEFVLGTANVLWSNSSQLERT